MEVDNKSSSSCGVDEEKVKVGLAGVDKTVMVTVPAVEFLEGKMQEGGVWEMVVERERKAGYKVRLWKANTWTLRPRVEKDVVGVD